jgi:hypothetical protein
MMKKHIFCSLLMMVFAMGLYSQNLQYGKSKLIDSKVDTVPSGRAWKVEGFIFSNTMANCPGSYSVVNIDDSIVLNGHRMAVRTQRMYGPSSNSWGAISPQYILWQQTTPMWLPAGATLSAGRGVKFINVIEFKEVP